MSQTTLADALGQAASDWLTENDPDGLDWFDARNVDDLVSALMPFVKAQMGKPRGLMGKVNARELLAAAGADIVGDQEESAYVFVSYLQRELDKLEQAPKIRFPEDWKISKFGDEIQITWANEKGFTSLTPDSWKEGVVHGLLYDLSKALITSKSE